MDDRITRINDMLIGIMGCRIKAECIAMSNIGMSIDDMNVRLNEQIIPYYEAWRQQMLARAMN